MTTKSIAWNTGSGNITLTYTGQGNGTIAVESDANDLGSARSQTIVVQTTDGVVTRNLTVSQAACPVPVGTVLNFAYTGSYQEVTLPAGSYKWQCWGAQGGSNAAASSYNISAQAGGKGGYSEGIITLSQKTTVRVYVGGQGSSSSGGFNGGGSTTGSSTYNASNEQGVSRMGGGGGATDIRLSDGALLSRMIVAGGGSGGAMCYKKVTSTSPSETLIASFTLSYTGQHDSDWGYLYGDYVSDGHGSNAVTLTNGKTYKVTTSGSGFTTTFTQRTSSNGYLSMYGPLSSGSQFTFSKPASSYVTTRVNCYHTTQASGSVSVYIYEIGSSSSTSTSNDNQVGYAGGGTSGLGNYPGTQSAAGSGGSFGQGAAMSASNYRYCSGAGGGGWYGGGAAYSDSSMSYVRYMGGGSGWVNIAANSGNRPSGYTGLQLDSGTTYAGSTSFPNTAGTGYETGHAGNGYAKITRLS